MGIWVAYDLTAEDRQTVSGGWPKDGRYRAIFHIEDQEHARRRRPGTGHFITNPEIRLSIAEAGIQTGMELGYMDLARANHRTIEWKNYFPFGRYLSQGRRIFGYRGIAQLLEYDVLARINKHFPEIKRVRHERFLWWPADVSEERRGQVAARGTGLSASMQHTLDMLRWKIGRDTLKHRGRVLIETKRGKVALQRVEARDPYRLRNKIRLRVKQIKQSMRRTLKRKPAMR